MGKYNKKIIEELLNKIIKSGDTARLTCAKKSAKAGQLVTFTINQAGIGHKRKVVVKKADGTVIASKTLKKLIGVWTPTFTMPACDVTIEVKANF